MTQPLEKILVDLELSAHEFLATFHGISEDRWRRKPDAESWSLEEVAEHLAIVEHQVRRLITERMMAQPATPEFLAATLDQDSRVIERLADPSPRAAPETVNPKGRWASPEELAESFRSDRSAIIEFVKSRAEEVDRYGADHPALGSLTLRQWLLFQVGHVRRHIHQMRRILEVV